MNALNFWFYFVLFGAGCGIGLLIETIIMLIIKAVRNRPRKLTLNEQAESKLAEMKGDQNV